MGPAKSTKEAYDPQGSGIGSADPVFTEAAPGVAHSGNMAHKWGPEGNHNITPEPPSGLKGE